VLLDHPRGLDRVLDADAIEILPVPQSILPLAVRGAQLGILAEHFLAARVQHQIHRLARREVRAQLVVLALQLLPAGGDQRHALGDVLFGHRRRERGVEPLRPEQDHGRHQRARTLAVWPTKSSMPRSSS
jgi:hypothetical protein